MDESYANRAEATPEETKAGHESLREVLDDAYATAMRMVEMVGLVEEQLAPVLTPAPEVGTLPGAHEGVLKMVMPRATVTQQVVDIQQQIRAATRRLDSLRGRLNL